MDHILKIYPADPEYTPNEAQEEAVIDALNEILTDAGDIDRNLYQKSVYVDAGDSIRSVVCPGCHDLLNVSDKGEYAEWWLRCMEKQMTESINTEVSFPCCKGPIPFKNLKTYPVTGISRFIVEIHLLEEPKELTVDDLTKVGDAMGCACYQVLADYAN